MGIAAIWTALFVVVGTLASGSTPAPAPKLDPGLLSGRYTRAIVGFDHDIDDTTIDRLSRVGITRAARFELIDAVGVLGPREAYTAIADWTDVRYVTPDLPLRFDNYAAKKDSKVASVRAGASPLRKKYTGKGITVAVIDTGIDDHHPDLDGQVIDHMNFEPAWVFEQINNGENTDALALTTSNPIDTIGHGTHVAGIIAGTGAAGGGADFSGVAPGAKLVNLKIAEAHQTPFADIGWESNALAAYEWAIEHRNDKAYPGGIRVVSNSWAIYEADSNAEPITQMVRVADQAGMISVFAAGNAGPGPDSVAVGPNRLPQVITVAASCKSVDSCGKGKLAEFSSRGKQVDITAPGDNIYSTVSMNSLEGRVGAGFSPPGDPANSVYYVGYSGTSMAAPHISGVVAVMLQANPRLSRYRVQQLLYGTAVDRGKPGSDTGWGHGMVDALGAVHAAETYRPAPKR